jgi:hypothetical protein
VSNPWKQNTGVQLDRQVGITHAAWTNARVDS